MGKLPFKSDLGLTPHPSFAGLPDLPFHCRSEPRKILLHDIIMSPGLHGGNSLIFTDLAGDDDKREIKAGFLKNFRAARALKPGIL